MVPADASPTESQLFANDLMTILETISPRPAVETVEQEQEQEEWPAVRRSVA
jgi:hypothetical protein